MVLRYLLGTFESVISPGFSMMTSVWYKQSEHASRHGAWFVGNSIASIFGGFISFGLANITTFAAWKVLFILYGGLTLIWGVVMMILLPNSPATAYFLTPTEREIAVARVASSQLDTSRQYKMSQVEELFRDPKMYLIVLWSFCSSVSNGALTNVRFSAL